MSDGQAMGRILGWDLLRGLSAFAVMAYHLTLWMGLAQWPSVGTHAVYVFFVLSGASLAYSHALKRQAEDFSWRAFFWARYWRLAPLFLLLLVPMVIGRLATGQTEKLGERLMWNATFTFGLSEPVAKSLLVGGWSLGVELVLYAIFPALVWLLYRPRSWGRDSSPAQAPRVLLLVGVLALALQWVWVEQIWYAATLAGTAHLPAIQVAYHQVPSFLGYFIAGVAWGVYIHRPALPVAATPASSRNKRAVGFVVLSFFLIVCAGSSDPNLHLWGWRGALLSALVVGAVIAATAFVIPDRLRKVSVLAGDATYGVYLIHPVVYFGVERALVPILGLEQIGHWSLIHKVSLGLAIGLLSFALAVISERRYEKPLRAFMGGALHKWMNNGTNRAKLG